MDACADCGQRIDSKTGLGCQTCRVPFCVSGCLKNHLNHKIENLPPSSSDDILGSVAESEKVFSELKMRSNALLDILRYFDSEITNHQLKLFSFKDRIVSSSRAKTIPKQVVDNFGNRHNKILQDLVHMNKMMHSIANDSYKLWGNIATFNYEEILGGNTTANMREPTPNRQVYAAEPNRLSQSMNLRDNSTYGDQYQNSMQNGSQVSAGNQNYGGSKKKVYGRAANNDIFGTQGTQGQVTQPTNFQTSSQSAYGNNAKSTPIRNVGNSVVNNNVNAAQIQSNPNQYQAKAYTYALPGHGGENDPQNRVNSNNYNDQFVNYNPDAQFEGKADKSAEELIKIFREKILKRGGNKIFQIGKHFNLYDKNKNRKLDLEEFKRVCREFSIGISPSEVEILFNAFDYDGVGSIDYNEFLRIIRGPMNERRRNAVLKLFDRLDKKGDGALDLADIKLMYNASAHPDSEMMKKSPDQVYYEFIESINTYTQAMKGGSNKDKISRDEWLEYYNNISASIDQDAYFLDMLNNCWNRKQ